MKQNIAKNLPAVASKKVADVVPVDVIPEDVDIGAFKLKRVITVTQLKQKEGTTILVRFEEPMMKADDRVDQVTGQIMPGPWIAIIVDLTTGQRHTYIIGAHLRGQLQKIPYVGKGFAIHMGPPDETRPIGRRFRIYTVAELE